MWEVSKVTPLVCFFDKNLKYCCSLIKKKTMMDRVLPQSIFLLLFSRCRKRRLDQISTLTEEVDQLESIRKEMQQERAALEVKLQ